MGAAPAKRSSTLLDARACVLVVRNCCVIGLHTGLLLFTVACKIG